MRGRFGPGDNESSLRTSHRLVVLCGNVSLKSTVRFRYDADVDVAQSSV